MSGRQVREKPGHCGASAPAPARTTRLPVVSAALAVTVAPERDQDGDAPAQADHDAGFADSRRPGSSWPALVMGRRRMRGSGA
ncbi:MULTISPECIES: hypothetical protein [unclassified Streptomyces]|uniref:hypothetical protein n=1 Tax=unclassified Streptomyces TaxID=2593676 RepID=UPI002E2E51F7|nr:hypothetical protein [Streptomyces sp. NBC_00223]